MLTNFSSSQDRSRYGGLRAAEWARLRSGWVASCSVHFAGAFAALACVLWLAAYPSNGEVHSIDLSAATNRVKPEPPVLVLPIEPEEPNVAELAEAEISRLSTAAIPPELHVELLDTAHRPDPESVSGQWVAARMLEEIARAEQLSQEDQLARLTSLTGQLNRISTEDSVGAVTGQLAALLGTEKRSQQPAANAVNGEFDLDTAQVHDVRRSEREPGQIEYVAILLDAKGHTLETPLSPAEGEQLFKVMELVKSNPLLERIYRGLAMSLLDKLLKPPPAAPSP